MTYTLREDQVLAVREMHRRTGKSIVAILRAAARYSTARGRFSASVQNGKNIPLVKLPVWERVKGVGSAEMRAALDQYLAHRKRQPVPDYTAEIARLDRIIEQMTARSVELATLRNAALIGGHDHAD